MKKTIYSFLLIVGLASNYAQASDLCDERGRTELMEYIIAQEVKLANLQTELASSHKKTQAQRFFVQLHINRCLTETCEDIEAMVDEGAQLEAQDLDGKTALDFCKTRKFYVTLRALGAPFQWNAWISNYTSHFLASGITLGLGLACLNAMEDKDKITKVFSELSFADNVKLVVGITMLTTLCNILEEALLEEDIE